MIIDMIACLLMFSMKREHWQNAWTVIKLLEAQFTVSLYELLTPITDV